MTRGLRLLSVLAPISALAIAGCYAEVTPAPGPAPAGEAVVETVPPEPAAVVEVQPAAPGPEYVWVGGHHRWVGRSYVWERGTYQRRPHGGAVWVHPRWENRGRGHVWVSGHWR
jgi:hypothetical protein